jgi:hypothetical protein
MTQLRKHLKERDPIETFSCLVLGERRWGSARDGYSPTDPFLWSDTDATTFWCSYWSRVTSGLCGSEQNIWIARLCTRRSCSAIFPPPIHKSVISAACQHIFELPGKSLSGTHRIRPVEPSQDDQACRSFDEAANGRAIAGRGHCGGSTSGIMLEIWPRRSNPCARGWRALCSDAARARVRGTGCHVATRTGPLDGLTRKVLPNAIRIFPLETPSHLFGQISSAQVCPDIPS